MASKSEALVVANDKMLSERRAQYAAAMKGRAGKDAAKALEKAQIEVERKRAEEERRARLQAKAKARRWKNYGPEGKGFATTHLKGEEYVQQNAKPNVECSNAK